jgi:hypothetical protein
MPAEGMCLYTALLRAREIGDPGDPAESFYRSLVVMFLAAFFAAIPVHAETADRVTLPVDNYKGTGVAEPCSGVGKRNNMVGRFPRIRCWIR